MKSELELDDRKLVVSDEARLEGYINTGRIKLVPFSKNGKKRKKGRNLYNRQLNRMRRLII